MVFQTFSKKTLLLSKKKKKTFYFSLMVILWCGLCNMNNTYLFYNPDVLPKFWAAPLYVIITTIMMMIIIIRGINNIIGELALL